METSESRTIGQVLGRTESFETRTCEKHGVEYQARHIVGEHWTRCPQCIEERRAEERKIEAENAERMRLEDIAAHLQHSAIPLRFKDASFDSFEAKSPQQRNALECARSYAEAHEAVHKDGTCLVFCGKAGTGKTHLSIAILNHVIRQGHSGLFTTVLRAIRAVKQTYSKDSTETEDKAISRFVRPGFLVLDEVGVQFGSDTEKLILFEIINQRYERMLPTVVLSNLAKEGLEEFIGERAFDRLREGGGKLVVFDWESYRKTA